MKPNYDVLGNYIQPIDMRNSAGKEENLLGVTTQKFFMPSIANTVGTDFSKYKIVRRGQFTYVPDTSRRGDRIAIALLQDWEEGLVSNIYTVFEVTDEERLMSEYLMLWFKRPEFDRYARFKSHGSVREIFDWDELCKVELPIPDIAVQRSIVRAYNTIEGRIKHLRELNDNLVSAAHTYFAKLFSQDSRFNDEGSEWYARPLGKSLEKVAMGPFGSNIKTDCFVDVGVPVLNGNNIADLLLNESSYRYVTEDKAYELKNSIAVAGDIVVTHRGTLGQIAYIPHATEYDRYVISQSQFMFRCDLEQVAPEYILFYFKTDIGQRRLLANNNTTGVPSIAKPTTYIKDLHIPIPPIELQHRWLTLVKPSIERIFSQQKEIRQLCNLQEILQASLAR